METAQRIEITHLENDSLNLEKEALGKEVFEEIEVIRGSLQTIGKNIRLFGDSLDLAEIRSAREYMDGLIADLMALVSDPYAADEILRNTGVSDILPQFYSQGGVSETIQGYTFGHA